MTFIDVEYSVFQKKSTRIIIILVVSKFSEYFFFSYSALFTDFQWTTKAFMLFVVYAVFQFLFVSFIFEVVVIISIIISRKDKSFLLCVACVVHFLLFFYFQKLFFIIRIIVL